MTRFTRYGASALLLATLAVLAACSPGGHGASASPSPSAMTDERLLAIGREYSQCLRDHGIPDVSEPKVWRGTLRFGEPQQQPDKADTSALDAYVEQMRAASEACQSIQDQVPERYLYQNWKPTSADVDAMGSLANCIRQHGFPEWPNPTGDGQFPIRGTSLEAAVKTDPWQEAFSACRKYYDGPLLTVSP